MAAPQRWPLTSFQLKFCVTLFVETRLTPYTDYRERDVLWKKCGGAIVVPIYDGASLWCWKLNRKGMTRWASIGPAQR